LPKPPRLRSKRRAAVGVKPRSRWPVVIGCCLGLAMLCESGFAIEGHEPMLDLRSLRFGPLPGQATGLLLSGSGPALVMEAEGRYGPPDAAVFSVDSTAYRWVYLHPEPSEKDQADLITFQTPQGEREFGPVVLATQKRLSTRHVASSNRLVRITVNQGVGSSESDRFLASDIQPIDGTNEFPETGPLIAAAIGQCENTTNGNDALRKAIDELKSSAPGSLDWALQSTVMPYVTWLSQRSEIELVCEREMRAEEAKVGIGIVPNSSGRQVAIDPSKTYGKVLRARLQLRYMIERNGEIRRVSETGIEKAVSSEPPPAGPTAR
jgi:hypothetical protein